jgi:AraC-like DNA-binding protein
MLCETNISIKEIAEKLGYTGTDHISRYFRKEKGISLIEYRRQYGQK